jgi:hypothetical protein
MKQPYHYEKVRGRHNTVVEWMNENHPNGILISVSQIPSTNGDCFCAVIWKDEGIEKEEERGAWQKLFVLKLTEQGVSHKDAMLAMALTCEERQKAYTQGYQKGYNDGDKNAHERPRTI